jgi:hypothetical protein
MSTDPLNRWLRAPQITAEQYELQLFRTSKLFKNHLFSIYILQKSALKI